jgi:hypothetical protein
MLIIVETCRLSPETWPLHFAGENTAERLRKVLLYAYSVDPLSYDVIDSHNSLPFK